MSESTGVDEETTSAEVDEEVVDVDESTDQTEISAEAPAEPAPEEVDVKGILTTTQDRVARILATTEAAAADIVNAANAESEQIVHDTHSKATELAQSKMDQIDSVTDTLLKRANEVTDTLMKKANEVAEEVEGLRKLIDTSIETLAQELGIADEAQPVATPQFSAEPEVVEQPVASEPLGELGELDEQEPVDVEDTNGTRSKGGLLQRMRVNSKRDASEGVKLLAAQMIAAGHTWEEARVRLSDEFGVKDPTIALDAVYRDGGVAE